MTDNLVPTIAPIKVKEYEVKQSKYPQCGKLPVRSILLGPSGAGKGVLLQNKFLELFINLTHSGVISPHTTEWIGVKKV